MKRFAKIAGIVLLAAVLCITAIACQEPKTNFEKVCDNVSAMQQSLYVASDDDFSVKITTMKQEELFIADGKADNLVTLTVLSVIPKDASKLNSTFEYTLEGDKEKLTGSIAKSKLGISLIFYVQFSLAYKRYLRLQPPADFKGTTLTAFANEGVVLLPISRAAESEASFAMRKNEEERLREAAMQGDQDAIETLTASDIKSYNEAADRIKSEDLYSVVEQSLMPSGIECDQYSVIGEIMNVEEATNRFTGEELWQLGLTCNEVSFKLCMRKKDLLGEPLCGRRVKARIWLLGDVELRRPV